MARVLKFLVIWCLVAIFARFPRTVDADEGTRQLLSHLFPDEVNHKPLIRPVYNFSDPIVVTLGLTVVNVLGLDFTEHSMTSYVWISLEWIDSSLLWDPGTFGGVDSVSVQPGMIWTPDLTVYNDMTGNVAIPRDKVLAVVRNNGHVQWIVPTTLKTTCDSLNENADRQNCAVKFGSWVHDGGKIDLRLPAASGTNGTITETVSADVSSVVRPVQATGTNPETRKWKLIGATGRRHVIYYACCPDPYNDVTYTLAFVRVRASNANATITTTAAPVTEGQEQELNPEQSAIKAAMDSPKPVVPGSGAAGGSRWSWQNFPSLRWGRWY